MNVSWLHLHPIEHSNYFLNEGKCNNESSQITCLIRMQSLTSIRKCQMYCWSNERSRKLRCIINLSCWNTCLLLFNASKLFLFYYEWCATWHAGPQQVDCCVSIRQDGGWLLYYLLVWWIRDSIRTVFWYVCFLLANSVHFDSIFALDNCCVTTFSSTVDHCDCGCSRDQHRCCRTYRGPRQDQGHTD